MGRGLAGSVLSLQLLEAGYKVMVVDQPKLSSSSRVAAGIWNPVVFKRLTKSWMADEILPFMYQFYLHWQNKFGIHLINDRQILKLFTEEQEAALWKKKAASEMADYLNPEIFREVSTGSIKISNAGYAKVLKAGNLNIPNFLEATQTILSETNSLLQEEFDYALFSPEKIAYKSVEAAAVIFCEGYLIKHNPWFGYIPMKPAKGEVLTVQINDLKVGNDIVNKNAFLMPMEGSVFKAGATYNWSDLNDQVTTEGQSEMTKKIENLLNCQFQVINHEAGVRPSVIDRRPVLGQHPKHKGLYIFNGMGTKGVMLAPFFANHLVEHISKGKSLNKDVDIARFNHFFVN